MYGYIYETINLINGKKYVGKHKAQVFEGEKYLGSGIRIKNAVSKYGKSNFKVNLIEECETEEILNEREKYWIKYFNALEDTTYYNLAKGGDGNTSGAGWKGNHHTKEAKLKIGLAHKGKKVSSETLAKIKNTMLNKSEEEKLVIKQHRSNSHKNKTHSLEQKEKIQKTLKEGYKTGKYKIPENRTPWNKGRKLSEDERIKHGNISRGRLHITNGVENKMIYPKDLDYFLSSGWRRGRTINKDKRR